jgi:hypothetical protein
MRWALVLALLPLSVPAVAQTDRPGIQVWGDGRMGLTWSDRNTALGPTEKGLRLTSRARLHFQIMGETDGGTQFGVNLGVDRDTNRPTTKSIFIGQ